jgi:hypothetical protein
MIIYDTETLINEKTNIYISFFFLFSEERIVAMDFDGRVYWNNITRGALLLQNSCLNAPRPDREHHRLTNDSRKEKRLKI